MGIYFQISLKGRKKFGFLLFPIKLSGTFYPSTAVKNIKVTLFLSFIFFAPDISFAFYFNT